MIVVLLATAISLGADTLTIRGGASCPSCRIVAIPVAELGRGAALQIDQTRLSLAQVRNSYLATGVGPTGTIAVFDSSGHVTRYIGRQGAGPGEFQQPTRIHRWHGDSVLVLDPALSRVSVLTPDLAFARSFTLRASAARLAGTRRGGIATTGGSESGPVLRLHTRDGSSQADVPGATDGLRHREVAVSPSGDLWTARVDRYELERRDSTGRVESVVRRVANWYPPRRTSAPVDLAREPGPPGLSGLFCDESGRIWVFIAASREPYKPPVVRTPDGGERFDIDLWFAQLDTRVEVIDPVAGRVVAEQRFRGLIYGTDHFPLAYRVHEDSTGERYVEAVRLEVQRP